MAACIVFPDRATADAVLKEISATPDVDGGIGPVWVWFDPDSDANVVAYAEGEDGRCAIAHPWSEIERAWLEAYLAAWPAVEVLDRLPKDWQRPQS